MRRITHLAPLGVLLYALHAALKFRKRNGVLLRTSRDVSDRTRNGVLLCTSRGVSGRTRNGVFIAHFTRRFG